MMYDVWTTQITSNLQDGNGKLDYEEFIKMLKQYDQVQNGENMNSSQYIFQLIFHWKGIYYGLLYHKTCLGISI